MARIRKYKVGQFVCSTYSQNEILMYIISDVNEIECWHDKKLNKYYYDVRLEYNGAITTSTYEWWELRPATIEEIKANKRLEWIR